MPPISPSCSGAVVVVGDSTRVVVAETPRQTVVSGPAAGVTVVEQGPQTIEAGDTPGLIVANDEQQTIQVGAMICLGTQPGAGGEAGVFTPSRPNGWPWPLYAGQPVCVVNGEFQPASSELGRYEAIGLVFEESIVAGGVGRAQTTGILELTAAQWDLVQTHVGGLVPERPYYLDPSGRMSPIPPENEGVLVRIGFAITKTQFSIDIEPPVIL